jgi:hypothetical protein
MKSICPIIDYCEIPRHRLPDSPLTPPLLRCSVQVEVGLDSFALQLQQPRNNNSCNNCYTNSNDDNDINNINDKNNDDSDNENCHYNNEDDNKSSLE